MGTKGQRRNEHLLNHSSSEGNTQLLKRLCFFVSPKGTASLALAWGLIFCCFVSSALADTPLQIAQSQIGLGEIGGNNQGIYVNKYLNGRDNLPWCAGFISYCLKKSGVKISYTLRARDFLNLGKQINNPKPNDLIVFSRQGGGHVGIVEKISPDEITTIEGNVGDYPAKVKRFTYKRNHIKNLLGFVRINA